MLSGLIEVCAELLLIRCVEEIVPETVVGVHYRDDGCIDFGAIKREAIEGDVAVDGVCV